MISVPRPLLSAFLLTLLCSVPLRAELSLTEHERLVASLREHRGNLAAAARALRLPRTTLFDKLSKHGLVPVKRLPRPEAEARP